MGRNLDMKNAGACFLLVISALAMFAQRKPATNVRETLRVRPLAQVTAAPNDFRIDRREALFFLAVEEPGGNVRPIQIAYTYYKSHQLPPESFWDYSKLYEVKVQRDTHCDFKVEDVAYFRMRHESGADLGRILVLRFAK